MKKTNSSHSNPADACAVAAAKGAALMLREQQIVDEVEIILPASETARFRLHGQKLVGDTASCYVISDSGDGRDVAKGAEVHVSIKVDFFTPRRILLESISGIGRAVGSEQEEPTEDEDDPAPGHMILEVVREVFAMRCMPTTLTVTVGIPGE
jgi:cobalt-precorrin-5B (C1)-methyltransferase